MQSYVIISLNYIYNFIFFFIWNERNERKVNIKIINIKKFI